YFPACGMNNAAVLQDFANTSNRHAHGVTAAWLKSERHSPEVEAALVRSLSRGERWLIRNELLRILSFHVLGHNTFTFPALVIEATNGGFCLSISFWISGRAAISVAAIEAPLRLL